MSQYVHPTEKQCNYSYTHPTTKQCDYSVPIVDNLTSTQTTSALSANQGKILKDLIDSSGSSQMEFFSGNYYNGVRQNTWYSIVSFSFIPDIIIALPFDNDSGTIVFEMESNDFVMFIVRGTSVTFKMNYATEYRINNKNLQVRVQSGGYAYTECAGVAIKF